MEMLPHAQELVSEFGPLKEKSESRVTQICLSIEVGAPEAGVTEILSSEDVCIEAGVTEILSSEDVCSEAGVTEIVSSEDVCIVKAGVPKKEDAEIVEAGVPKEEDTEIIEAGVPKEEDAKIIEAGVPKEEDAEIVGAGVPKEEDAKIIEAGVPKEEDAKIIEAGVPKEEDAEIVGAGVPKEEDAKIIEAGVPKEEDAEIIANDVYMTVEDCAGELEAANGSTTEPSWGDVPDELEPVPVTPRFVKLPRPAPENQDVDEVVKTMRNILMDLRNEDDARLKPEDEEKVRSLLEHHPKAEEKMGSGIDYIKIKRHSTFKDARCFWVVRTDGTETDFSYHKCLKEKVAKEHPGFVDRYDAIYRAPKRARQS